MFRSNKLITVMVMVVFALVAVNSDSALSAGKGTGRQPKARFVDNGDGTVTDNSTGLVWMKNANAFGICWWDGATEVAQALQDGQYGLTDGSQAGDWRVPTIQELISLVDYGACFPALPAGHPFVDVILQSDYNQVGYLSCTGYAPNEPQHPGKWIIRFSDGAIFVAPVEGAFYYLWPVRNKR
jgi:hypothetical protein